jgi:protoporphyrinogen oxidase
VDSDLVVLGGGITGLSLADAAARHGRSVAVLEARPWFGGLLRTLNVEGQLFDTGPHGIYSHDQEVLDWFRGLLGDELRPIERNSYTLFRGRRVAYPLTVRGALAAVRPWEAARIAWEAGVLRSLHGTPPPRASFEEWATRSFGRTIYRLFFEQYTQKVWGLPCRELSASWIDVHLPANSLLQVLYDRLKRKDLPIGFVSRFFYSAHGSGRLVDRLVEELERRPRVCLRRAVLVRRISRIAGGWRVSGHDGGSETGWTARELVSTIPVTALLGLLDPPPPPDVLEEAAGLRFRNLILALFVVDRPRLSDANWLYVPDPAVSVARISEFKNMIASMQDRPDTSIEMETFCWPDDPRWREADEDLAARARDEAERLGLFPSRQVKAWKVVRVPNAYPVFDLGYELRMRRIHEHLRARSGLHLLGRTGGFLYLDQAGCVKQSFAWARERFEAAAS